MDSRPLAQLPWAVSHEEFARAASRVGPGGACCVFVIDQAIPNNARNGYAALVIAYARADEPVYILEDGAAVLLVRDGGTTAAEVAARRVIGQMQRLALEQTLRAGVAPLGGDVDAAMIVARSAAENGAAGGITVAK